MPETDEFRTAIEAVREDVRALRAEVSEVRVKMAELAGATRLAGWLGGGVVLGIGMAIVAAVQNLFKGGQ